MNTVKNIFSKLLPSRGNSLEEHELKEEKENKKVMNKNKAFYPLKSLCGDWRKYGFCFNDEKCGKQHQDCISFAKDQSCKNQEKCENFHRINSSKVPEQTLKMLSKECASCKLKKLMVNLNCGHSPYCEDCVVIMMKIMKGQRKCNICKSEIVFFI